MWHYFGRTETNSLAKQMCTNGISEISIKLHNVPAKAITSHNHLWKWGRNQWPNGYSTAQKTSKTCKGRRVNHDVTNHGALHNYIILYIYILYIYILGNFACHQMSPHVTKCHHMSPNVTKRHQSRIVEFRMLG